MEQDNLKTLEELKEIVEQARKEGKNIVTTNGCYDIIHKGHIHILKEMSKLGDIFIVAINSDESVRKFKGFPKPYNNEKDRAFVIGHIKGVDYVIIFNDDNPLEILKTLKPEVHTKGGAGLCERIREEKELIEGYGGKMICLDLIEGYSTSDVIEKIKKFERF